MWCIACHRAAWSKHWSCQCGLKWHQCQEHQFDPPVHIAARRRDRKRKQESRQQGQHKTAKTYGSIAKLLTPGLKEAFKVYASLHRPEGFKYFLVPPKFGTAKVSLPHALKQACKHFLPEEHPILKFNLVRKLFHRALRKISKDDESLKDLMVILDAHSAEVQDSNYILKDPEDDAKLAEQLVKVVLGTTVAFPSEAEVLQCMADNSHLKQHLHNLFYGDDEQDSGDEKESEDEDEELEHFKKAEIFGVKAKPPEANPQSLAELFVLPADFFQPLSSQLALTDGKPEATAEAATSPVKALTVSQQAKLALEKLVTPVKGESDAAAEQAEVDTPVKGKRIFLTPDQKAFLEKEAPKDSHGAILCPDKLFLLEVLAKGTPTPFPAMHSDEEAFKTYERARSHLKSHQGKLPTSTARSSQDID